MLRSAKIPWDILLAKPKLISWTNVQCHCLILAFGQFQLNFCTPLCTSFPPNGCFRLQLPPATADAAVLAGADGRCSPEHLEGIRRGRLPQRGAEESAHIQANVSGRLLQVFPIQHRQCQELERGSTHKDAMGRVACVPLPPTYLLSAIARSGGSLHLAF